jgi:hypothetical protein
MFKPTKKLSCAVQNNAPGKDKKQQSDILMSTPEENIWNVRRDLNKATILLDRKQFQREKI